MNKIEYAFLIPLIYAIFPVPLILFDLVTLIIIGDGPQLAEQLATLQYELF
jgi:hypothetical protein